MADKTVFIRMPQELRAELETKAKVKGLNLSSYLRMVLLEHVKKEPTNAKS